MMEANLRRCSATVLACLMLLGGAGVCAAALSKDQGRCQSGAAKSVVSYFRSESKALAACGDAIGVGDLPLATDCRTEAATALTDAAGAFDEAVRKGCSDASVASLRYASSCEGVGDVDELLDCIAPASRSATDSFLARIYSAVAVPASNAIECRETVSREARKYAAKAVGALHKCKNLASKGKLAAGSRCEEDEKFLSSVAKLRGKLALKLAAACDAPALAGAAFGPACDAPADADALVECLDAGVTAMTAALAPAEYGDGGLCGDAHNSVEGSIDALLVELSLSEKIRLMAGSGFLGIDAGWQTPAINRLDLPGFRMLDGPRGVGRQSGNATAFPVGMSRGASWDVDLEERVGEAIGVETRAKGASVLLAPVTTVVRHPRWGRSQETYGEDPVLLGDMGTAFVRGAQRHVLASLKHFALNSIEDTRYTVSVDVDERTLREIYLPHFHQVVTEGEVASVMTAYNRVNGTYCSENSHLLRDILKGEWGFRGFVESDWIDGTRSTAPAALAGLDIEMPEAVYFTRPLLEPLVLSNAVPESVIDDSVRRNLRAKFCFRLDTDPPVKDPSAIETPEHLALAREAAEKGSVLLKNTGAALPLPAAPTIAVIGPLADLENLGDDGSSDVTPSSAVTVLEGLVARNLTGSIVHVVGDPNSPGNAAILSGADAVVAVVGFTEDDEGETFIGAGDRDTYELPVAQEQLLHDVAALSSRTIVVLESGSTVGVENWIGEVEALLMAWYPGMEGGHAIAGLLFGDVNPSGKLPLVMAKTEADLPDFINDQIAVTYEYWHGYRLLDHEGVEPRYPFGFGLSYTTFAYSNLQLESSTLGEEDTLRVTFDVTNTGGVAGEEVAQLYVGYPASLIERPVLDLRGFARVALAPAEMKSVSLEVPVAELAWYDVGLPGWAIEHMTYAVHVGGSSRDLPLSSSFDVAP